MKKFNNQSPVNILRCLSKFYLDCTWHNFITLMKINRIKRSWNSIRYTDLTKRRNFLSKYVCHSRTHLNAIVFLTCLPATWEHNISKHIMTTTWEHNISKHLMTTTWEHDMSKHLMRMMNHTSAIHSNTALLMVFTFLSLSQMLYLVLSH